MKQTFIVIIIFFILGCMQKGEKVIFKIPFGYKGQVFVFYNIKEGADKKYENGYRIYEIPNNGILKTQFSPNYGHLGIGEYQYVYVDSLNKEYPLKSELQDYKSTDSNEVYIAGGETGGIGDKLEYETFIVKSNKDSFVYVNRFPNGMDSILKKVGLTP